MIYMKNNKVSKRKETETVINIINNYIKENKHNIKEYIANQLKEDQISDQMTIEQIDPFKG